jgi:hypothetical protein
MVRRDSGKPAGNFSWGNQGAGGSGNAESGSAGEGEAQGKKKGKKGKQVLVAWG